MHSCPQAAGLPSVYLVRVKHNVSRVSGRAPNPTGECDKYTSQVSSAGYRWRDTDRAA